MNRQAMNRQARLRALIQAASAWMAVALLVASPKICQGENARGFVDRVFKDETGVHKYVVFVPENYSADKKWPVILYLHGAGERGNDGRLQTTVGLGPSVRARAKTFPFVVVFPQCEELKGRILTSWSPESPDGKRALSILDAVEKDFRIDPSRRVLTGWSMGGYGVWSIAAGQAVRFSAIVPVSGGGNPEWAKALTKTPVWAFHGAKDEAVPVTETRKMMEALKAAGSSPRYTEFPDVAHDVWKTVYESEDLYRWMLDPQTPPPSEAAIVARPGSRPAAAAAADEPFVPAVEMPRAVHVRLGNDMLSAVAHSVPFVVPKDVLQGRINDIYDSTTAEGRTFSVALTQISYAGQLARAYVKAYRKDRLNIQLGMENVVLQIGSSYIQGSGRSAVAGPMNVVIGHRAPVWLSLDVTPYVQDRKLKLKLVGTRFEIPDDNWYVTSPAGVSTSGLGMTSDRVSNGLVNGIYEKKYRLESEVVAVVPSLMSRLEEQLKVDQVNNLVDGFWPLPVYKPRVRAWPEAVETDENGVSLEMGVTAAAVDPKKAPRVPQVVAPLGPPIGQMPHGTRLEVGVAPNLLGPLTELLVRADVARIHVLDIPNKTFAPFADPKALASAIPDLSRLGEKVEVWSELVLVEPLAVVDAPERALEAAPPKPEDDKQSEGSKPQPAGKAAAIAAKEEASSQKPEGKSAGKQSAAAADAEKAKAPESAPEKAAPPVRKLLFRAPRVVISLAYRTDSKADWKPYAEFSFDVSQPAAASVQSPNYDERELKIEWSGDPAIVASGRFAPGYKPAIQEMHIDQVRDLFANSWTSWTHIGSAAQTTIPDIDLGYSKLRLERAEWTAPYLQVTFGEPGVKLSNQSEGPLEYETKGPFSGWGGPYTLKPGATSEFNIDYPLLFRRKIDGKYEMFTLPVGSQSEFRPPTRGGKAQLFKARRISPPAKSVEKGA